MIDYGNEELCPVSDLRKTIMYTSIPSFSYKIRLHNVFPKNNKWDAADLDRLHNIFAERTIVAILKEKQKPGKASLADVYTEDGLYMNDYIVEKSKNLSRKPCKQRANILGFSDDDLYDDNDEDVIIEGEEVSYVFYIK